MVALFSFSGQNKTKVGLKEHLLAEHHIPPPICQNKTKVGLKALPPGRVGGERKSQNKTKVGLKAAWTRRQAGQSRCQNKTKVGLKALMKV